MIDQKLSRGLVRAETRGLTDALETHTYEVLNAFHEGVVPHFEKRSRLTLPEMKTLANDLHVKAQAAFSPLKCDLEILPPTRGRPNSGSYEMLHYWINPKTVEGTSNRLMMIAMFSAWGTRKQTSLRAHDTLTSFYEHAAHRLLQRCGTKEHAVRAIGNRLVETIIVPTLALYDTPASLLETEFPIPFLDGALIGRFLTRSEETPAGDHKTIWKGGWTTRHIKFPLSAEFVVKTYLGPAELNYRQRRAIDQVQSWLDAHQVESEIITRFISYKLGNLWDNGHMPEETFTKLVEDFGRLHSNVTSPYFHST